MQFTLRQLGYVQAAADHQSIAQAAERLRISQSSISSAIDKLEAEFSVRIFVRQPSKGLMLTPSGKLLLEKVRALLRQAETFDAELHGWSERVSGELTIGCFAPVSSLVLPVILKSLAMRFPALTIRILEGDLRSVNALLNAGAADVILSYDLGLPEGVLFEKLGEARPHAVVAENHALAGRKRLSIRELAGEPMILLDLPESRTYFELLFRIAGIQPDIVYRTGSYETARGFVAAGLGYSILNLRPAIDETYLGNRVACIPFEENLPMPAIGIGLRQHDFPSDAIKGFAEECRRFFTPMTSSRLFVS